MKRKYKRECLPELRKLTKELEDAIVEKDIEKERESRSKLNSLISKIKSLPFIEKEKDID